jgi:hypothetical protein
MPVGLKGSYGARSVLTIRRLGGKEVSVGAYAAMDVSKVKNEF